MSVHDGVMARFLPAATVGFIPTVFVGWDVGWVCRRSGLLEFFAFFIYDIVFGFKSQLFVTLFIISSMGVSWKCLFAAISLIGMDADIVGDCMFLC